MSYAIGTTFKLRQTRDGNTHYLVPTDAAPARLRLVGNPSPAQQAESEFTVEAALNGSGDHISLRHVSGRYLSFQRSTHPRVPHSAVLVDRPSDAGGQTNASFFQLERAQFEGRVAFGSVADRDEYLKIHGEFAMFMAFGAPRDAVLGWWDLDTPPATLPSGGRLEPGGLMRSEGGQFYARFEADGTFKRYPSAPPPGSTAAADKTMGTAGNPADQNVLVIQTDGNLVVYKSALGPFGPGTALWASHTWGNDNQAFTLRLTDAGEVQILYANGTVYRTLAWS